MSQKPSNKRNGVRRKPAGEACVNGTNSLARGARRVLLGLSYATYSGKEGGW